MTRNQECAFTFTASRSGTTAVLVFRNHNHEHKDNFAGFDIDPIHFIVSKKSVASLNTDLKNTASFIYYKVD